MGVPNVATTPTAHAPWAHALARPIYTTNSPRALLAHSPPQLVLILPACGGAVEGRSQVRAALELFRNLAGRSEREALLRRGLERTTPGPVCGAGASGEAERVDASNQGA